jgi:hypothetical protein
MSGSVVPAALTPWPARPGPVTRALLLRSLRVYALMYLAGAALALCGGGPWQAAGVGLLWPGAGWCLPVSGASAGDPSWFIGLGVLLGLFPGALLLWFATGNAAAPPLVWLGAAAAALARQGLPSDTAVHQALAWPGIALAAAALVWAWHLQGGRRVRRRAQQRLAAAAPALPQIRSQARSDPSALDLTDLQRCRFLLDRALQPLDEFEGFEWLDQYQTAAVRYQLQFAGYALALLQASHQPAFTGYLRHGQRQLILKLGNPRVWRYWALERLWGHGRLDPDPTARDNIMYTGFGALQMALTQAAGGVREWLEPGSLVLRHPRRGALPADLSTLGRCLQRDLAGSPLTLMACEPNWVYPLCNTLSASALAALEAQTGQPCWSPHAERFRHALITEFMAPGGHFVPFRSLYTGWAAPVMGGALPVAMTCFFLHALWPDLAWQQWLLLRERLLCRDGRTLRRRAFWSLDVGNYRRSDAAALAGTALAARELGDETVALLCLEALEARHPDVVRGAHRHRSGLSVWGHALETMARCTSAGAFRRLVLAPAAPVSGPLLAEVPYHQVMVASARQTPEGLQAALVPLQAGHHAIGFSGLRPGRPCELLADGLAHPLVADARGQATLKLSFGALPRQLCLKQNPEKG